MEVTDALVESVCAETIPKMPKAIKNALPHIFSDEKQLVQLIDKFANTVFNLPMHAGEMGLESVKVTEKYLKHIFGVEAVEFIERT